MKRLEWLLLLLSLAFVVSFYIPVEWVFPHTPAPPPAGLESKVTLVPKMGHAIGKDSVFYVKVDGGYAELRVRESYGGKLCAYFVPDTRDVTCLPVKEREFVSGEKDLLFLIDPPARFIPVHGVTSYTLYTLVPD